jgi:Secretion system C-terminal sorting domain/Thermolysin metallopeptidase, catalytic domain/Peptidase propeptide and YPEB domain
MKKIIYSICALSLINTVLAQSNDELRSIEGKDPLEKTFVKDIKKQPDADFQFQLRNAESWKNFASKASQWQVTFNEGNQLPHRASGPGIKLPTFSTENELLNHFANTYLSDYQLPLNELELKSNTSNAKHNFYHFKQTHNGKEILNSDLYLKLSKQNDLIVFGLDVFKNIPNVDATIDLNTAKTYAQRNIKGITNVSADGVVKILPVEGSQMYNYYPVYEITVETMNENSIPAKYYTLVNANTGDVLYRQNLVKEFDHHPSKSANAAFTLPGKVSANYYKLNNFLGASLGSLGYVRLTTQGQTFFADSAGVFNLPFSSASESAIISLQGKYSDCRVINGSAPTISATLTQSQNNITFGAPATIEHLSAYNAVNRIHDYMKSKFPTFTTLDISMPTNINLTNGTCNAFYNGNSVNFYAAGGGCSNIANVADVVYHEYGHGINDQFYSTFGGSFNNGGMNEGYADVWALGLTQSPILGTGFFPAQSGFVRRYDINKKVYPADLSGEVHADGEIIAGSWWDYGVEIGNVQNMMDLFKSTYPALLTAPNGQEGKLYADVLLEAITEDDNDNNIANGTPHFCQLIKAFGIHGIELYGSLKITGSSVVNTGGNTVVTANIANTNIGPKNIQAFYNTTGTNYTQVAPAYSAGQLSFNVTPAAPAGSIVKYYFTSQDTCANNNSTPNFYPPGSNQTLAYPNLPFIALLGYNLIETDSFEITAGDWELFDINDNATTGIWTIDFPVGSFQNPASSSGMVQTNNDHTSTNIFAGKCAITGNALSVSAGIGDEDVDGGKTTLTSKFYDLTGLTDPTFSYWRWYSNDQGATPKTDFWKVQISNDNITWQTIENTLTPDHGWRRNAFRVLDYVTLTPFVQIRFIAEDANAGSLVEAAVDDVELFATNNPLSAAKIRAERAINMYPNPAKEMVSIVVGDKQKISTIKVTDQLGREVKSVNVNGLSKTTMNVSDLNKGIYFVSITTDKVSVEQKLIIK